MAIAYSTSVRNSMLSALVTAAGSGAIITIYDSTGTGRPSTGGAITTQQAIVAFTCAATLGTVSGGVLTFNTITPNSTANFTSSGSLWFRITTSGATFLMDGSAGVGGDLNLSSNSINSGATVTISSMTITEGNP